MFQPQATPYCSSSYGISPPLPNFAGFQTPAGAVDSSRGQSQGSMGFPDRIFSPTANQNQNGPSPLNFNHNNNTTITNHHGSGLPLDYRKMNTNDDIDAQEALARDYNPALEGPLVGEKKSSQAITEEYAKADPIYVAKTAALPQKYSHYRPILGDGNCGWRAAGFAYFETLLRSRDKDQLEGEMARMISLNNLLSTVGQFSPWMFEDMVEETTDLLRYLADLVETSPREAENLLLERFNDKGVSDAIVYHFRLLASSCLKGNPQLYQGFIPDVGIEDYVKNSVLIPNQEIDHLGMTVLIDVLLKPIGFAVEILYLDRSPGSQANTHIFQTVDANGIPTNPNGPIIHLLYRPSHYDILYKDHGNAIQAVEEATRNTNIQVNRATNFSQQQAIQGTPVSMGGFSQMDMSLLSCIPSFSLAPSHHGFPSQYSTQIDTYPPSPISASISPISPGASSATTSSNAIPASFPAQPPPPSSLTSPTLTSSHPSFSNPTIQLPIHSHIPPPPPPQHRPSLSSHPSLSAHSSELSSPSSATKSSSQFRPSRYEWEAAAATGWQEGPVVFQTSTFKNSHYNTAHYNNPNFQPEEWSPESEDPPPRKRSS